jgi:hypothetical protein
MGSVRGIVAPHGTFWVEALAGHNLGILRALSGCPVRLAINERGFLFIITKRNANPKDRSSRVRKLNT